MAVFDASPLVAVLLGEPGGLVSGRMLADSSAEHAICALNAAEVLDRVSRESEERAGEVASAMQLWFDAGVHVVPLDWELAQRTAELRSLHYHRTRAPVSLADCSAIALSQRMTAELVTSDATQARIARAEGVAVLPVPDSSGRTPK
jgi:predicted nucleic acid-binding protein